MKKLGRKVNFLFGDKKKYGKAKKGKGKRGGGFGGKG